MTPRITCNAPAPDAPGLRVVQRAGPGDDDDDDEVPIGDPPDDDDWDDDEDEEDDDEEPLQAWCGAASPNRTDTGTMAPARSGRR